MEVDEERAHLESAPDEAGLERLAAALGGGRVTVVRRLGGGLDCATHLLRLGDRHLVLKRSQPGAATAAREHAHLEAARHAPVPTPEPVALDEDGAWFGTPSLVMTFVDGQPNLHPADPDRWVRELARGLAAVHDAPVREVATERPPLWQRWEPSEADGDLAGPIAAAVADLRAVAAGEPAVFSHDDYHPGNVVWHGDRLAGIVDWLHASMSPRSAAVAYCRKDLAIHPGGDVPDRFLAAYEAETGLRLGSQPLWDVLEATVALRWGHRWVPSFTEVGVGVTADDIARASRSFVEAALRRCR